jgi:hypothetical protein
MAPSDRLPPEVTCERSQNTNSNSEPILRRRRHLCFTATPLPSPNDADAAPRHQDRHEEFDDLSTASRPTQLRGSRDMFTTTTTAHHLTAIQRPLSKSPGAPFSITTDDGSPAALCRNETMEHNMLQHAWWH